MLKAEQESLSSKTGKRKTPSDFLSRVKQMDLSALDTVIVAAFGVCCLSDAIEGNVTTKG